MLNVVLVAIGGALGSVARYGVSLAAGRWLGLGFPYGTLFVNITGSFAMGALIAWLGRHVEMPPEWRLFLAVGVLGGYTTFSSSVSMRSSFGRVEPKGRRCSTSGCRWSSGFWRSRPGWPSSVSSAEDRRRCSGCAPNAVSPLARAIGKENVGSRADQGGGGRDGPAPRSLVQDPLSGLGFGHLQKLLRSGQVRIDGGRAKTDTRLEAGQMIRVPPMGVDAGRPRTAVLTPNTMRDKHDGDVLGQMLIYEDEKVYVFNKRRASRCRAARASTATSTGCWKPGATSGREARLVHRIDRDTSGILVVARTRGAAVSLTKAFRERDTKKLLLGPREGRTDAARRPDLHLPRQGADAGRRPDADRQARRGGR